MAIPVRSVVCCTLFACLVSGCATHQISGKPVPAPGELTVTANSFFSVDAVNAVFGGCKVEVEPSVHKQKIRVQVNSLVAWIATNYCDGQEGLDLSNYIFQDGTHVPTNELFDWTRQDARVWIGRVKDTARKGKYKYTAKIGTHVRDPDIIIF